MAEAVTLMDSIVKAQRRKYMQRNRYAVDFRGLDVSPKGATGNFYRTYGDGSDGNQNGFVITIEVAEEVDAYRVVGGTAVSNSLQYQYHLSRNYQSDNVSCRGLNQAGQELCADFCGIDTPVSTCCTDGTSARCNN